MQRALATPLVGQKVRVEPLVTKNLAKMSLSGSPTTLKSVILLLMELLLDSICMT